MGFLATILLGVAVYGISMDVPSEIFVKNEREVVEEVEVEEELDIIEESQKELERINAELDAEESRLIEERNEIDVRLEKIIETRKSFQ